ncbi:MAG: hypothetical protein VX405_01785 [Myxococcota bacterium]|nr:hypothetical protein [Myxococcota bacterium]
MMHRLWILCALLPLVGCPASTADCDGRSVGENYPSADGCNTCSCTAEGEICTTMACAEPDAGPSDAGGSSSDGGTPSVADAGSETPLPTDACQNDSDLAAHDLTYGNQSQTISELATDCAVSCFMGGRGDDPSCVTECLQDRTDNGVTSDCATCYAASAACARDNNCAGVCLADAEATNCVTCRCGQNDESHPNCYEVFAACSGFAPSNDCQ